MLERIFDPENGFWTLISKLYKVCALSILWFICSIPIFTFGAATAAFYDFTLHLVVDQEGNLLKSFGKAFVSNFRKATISWLLLLGAGVILAVDAWLCFHNLVSTVVAIPLLAMLAFVLLLWILVFCYLFPVQARYELKLSHLFRNSLLMAIAYFPFTILILFVMGIFLYLSLHFPLFSVFLIGIGMFVNSYLFYFIFEKNETRE